MHDASGASQVLPDVSQDHPDLSRLPDTSRVRPSPLVMPTEPFSPHKVKSTIRGWFGDLENGLDRTGMQAMGLFFDIDISVSSRLNSGPSSMFKATNL
jgi:hypothetical protein